MTAEIADGFLDGHGGINSRDGVMEVRFLLPRSLLSHLETCADLKGLTVAQLLRQHLAERSSRDDGTHQPLFMLDEASRSDPEREDLK